jgi:endonuclease YncB( thermonuclease family)
MIDSTIIVYATRQLGATALAAALALPFVSRDRSDARPLPAALASLSGQATVIDGDTIDIDGVRIRLEGIDAPEASQTCGRRWLGSWRCGEAAATELTKLVSAQRVTCESRGADRYGRMLGSCFAGGLHINAEMVNRGLAWAFVKYSTTYQKAEADARARKAGIWQGEAQPPWEYRQARWITAENTAPVGCAIKGNVTANGRIYHMPWSPWYDQIRMAPEKGKRWFCSEAEAVAAGWRPVQIN